MASPHERRIEGFRSDLTPTEVADAATRHARAVASLFYLLASPAFLNLRQLGEVILGRRYVAPDRCPLGAWVLMRDLADPTTTTVSPNVDTLYGAAYLLLREQGPVVCSMPAIADRYASVAFMDAYFDNFAIVSPRTQGTRAGHYLLVPPGWRGEVPDAITATFEAPTSSVCAVQRIFTRGRSDLETIHALQDAIVFAPRDGWLRGETEFPAIDTAQYEIAGMRAMTDPLEFFRVMSAYTGANPPPGGVEAGLVETFRAVGVGPGSTLPDDADLRAALVAGARDAQAAIDAAITDLPSRGGWRVPVPSAGRSGGDLLTRAAVQATQMELLPLEEATYHFGYRDDRGAPLDGARAYELRFADPPPTGELGFWSVTMYDERSLLVENPIDRYVIRPDTEGLTYGKNGSLAIRIQHDRPSDAPHGNWLPAPDGGFNLALRTYLGEPAVLDGSWFPPPIRAI